MKPVLVIRHVPHEGLGLLAEVFSEAGLAYSYVDMFGDPPRSCRTAHLAGLVVLGGPMNVDQTDRYPLLLLERQWIAEAIAADVPVLGICLGAQLLARTLGAAVYPADKKEIGWHPIRFAPAAADDPLFADCGLELTVFHWHGDTFDLPESCVLLASSQVCPQQAFRYGNSAYGLQFHLEMTEELLGAWLAEPAMCAELSEVPAVDPQEIRRRAPEELAQLTGVGRKVLSRFAGLCAARKGH